MDKKYKILIVDDTEINRSLLADMLDNEYDILEASNGLEAIAVLEKQHEEISLLLLDIVMPQMDGFEVLTFMNKSMWIQNTPVITISAETSSSYIDKAYDLGATDYISRPFDENTVQRRVKNTIMLYAKQKMLENMVMEQILEKEKSNQMMVEILSNIVEFRNGESGMHVLHIRTLTELLLKKLTEISEEYPFTSAQIALISNASALHDIGKISIPESILNKPGKLTDEEFEVMKKHSEIGAQILENAPYHQQEELIQVAHDICRWHHERYDGKGYPDGLKGDEIPISAQVVAMADVYDALTNERIYKPAYTHEKALQMIFQGECGSFNPLLLTCLKEIGPELKNSLAQSVNKTLIGNESIQVTRTVLSGKQTSNRTLSLLEQERTKYQFFASMSKEIQFEYNEHTDVLTLSEWGAQHLGLSEIILHPIENAELQEVFHAADYQDLHEHLRKRSIAKPVYEASYCLTVHGAPRWYKVIARPLWVEEETLKMTGTIGKFLDIHEERMKMEALKVMAVQDSLTKLWNHMAAKQRVEALLAGNNQETYAMILIDLDNFKHVNDHFGHLFGDEVLRYVAKKFSMITRKSDIVARIGGDEFLIFMEYKDHIEQIVNRIFIAFKEDYKGFAISLSIGVALYPKDGVFYKELFQHADQALYAAKNSGRSRFCFYNSSIHGYASSLSPIDQ